MLVIMTLYAYHCYHLRVGTTETMVEAKGNYNFSYIDQFSFLSVINVEVPS